MNPRIETLVPVLNLASHEYLGLTDFVELERAARRARARYLALAVRRGLQFLFGATHTSTVVDFSREDLLAMGVPSKDVRIALAGQSLGNAIGTITQQISALWQRAAAEAELRGLDDRTLHDMGLSRSDIPAAVAGEIYRGEVSNDDAGEVKVQVLKQKDVVAA